MCVCVIICVCVIVSSPYLLVFGDHRVRGTREHMMLLVWRLAPILELLGNSDNFRGQQECVAPLVKVVLPGDTCRGKVCNGAWRHTSPVRRSEKHVAPSNS